MSTEVKSGEAQQQLAPGRGSAEPHTLRLSANTGIREVIHLKQSLFQLLTAPEVVVVDISNVQHIDTAALQLLFAFSRDRRSSGRSLRWEGGSDAWRCAIAMFGSPVGPDSAFTNC